MMATPDAVHGRGTDVLGSCHHAHAPMSRIRRLRAESRFHNRGFLLRVDRLRPIRPRVVLQDADNAFAFVAPPPQKYGRQTR